MVERYDFDRLGNAVNGYHAILARLEMKGKRKQMKESKKEVKVKVCLSVVIDDEMKLKLPTEIATDLGCLNPC